MEDMKSMLMDELKNANKMLKKYEDKILDEKPAPQGDELKYLQDRVEYWSNVAQDCRTRLLT